MEWDPARSPQDLKAAVEGNDDYRVRELSEALIDQIRLASGPYELTCAETVLSVLRSGRQFAQLKQIARALIECGQRAPVVRRHYAQVLIEEGEFVGAEDLLEALSADAARRGDEHEKGEAQGLIGRLFKQRYVNEAAAGRGRPDDLKRATQFYLDAYDASPSTNLWHGINAVALLERAMADGVTIPRAPQPIAQQILTHVESRFEAQKANAWDKATAMEANVALGKPADALLWLMRYVNDMADASNGLERVDAFKFASTYRQLLQVWRLNPGREPGSLLLPHLDAAMLRARDGSLRREPADVRLSTKANGFESRYGPDRWYALQWLRTGDIRAARVARVSHRDTGMTKGTGFLIRGTDLHSRYADETFLMTNSHVISGLRSVHESPELSPLRLEQAEVHLDVANTKLVCREIVWESPPDAEDVTVIALERPIQIETPSYPVYTKKLPVGGTGRIFIIGYPEGSSQVCVSFDNNQLLEMNDTYLRYRTPTEKGSSGSPLFDSEWQLVGIHHFSSEALESFRAPGTKIAANQGIWIRRIQEAIALRPT